MEQGTRFKAMYASLGLTVDDVAHFLQVSPRTVQLWISGRVRIPYAAYKLLRLQLRYELPGDAWKGWHLSAGRLYTPEGFELNPHDFSWWGLLVRRAALFSSLYAKTATVAGRAAPVQAVGTRSGTRPGPAQSGPTDEVRRPAQPAGPNSFLGHFRTEESENPVNPRLPARSTSDVYVKSISQHEKGACMARSRTRQLGGSGGGTGRRAARLEVAQVVQQETSNLRKAGKLPFEGSPLLRSLLARSEPAGQVAKPSRTVRRAPKGGA
jgi:hypothetical protein